MKQKLAKSLEPSLSAGMSKVEIILSQYDQKVVTQLKKGGVNWVKDKIEDLGIQSFTNFDMVNIWKYCVWRFLFKKCASFIQLLFYADIAHCDRESIGHKKLTKSKPSCC